MEKSKSLNPLGIYASWFREQLPLIQRPCYVLGPPPPLLERLLVPAKTVKEGGKTFPSFTAHCVCGGERHEADDAGR
jgi:hypothetical protein